MAFEAKSCRLVTQGSLAPYPCVTATWLTFISLAHNSGGGLPL